MAFPFFNLSFSSSQASESAAPSLRSANLSALKKRWEQGGQLTASRVQEPSEDQRGMDRDGLTHSERPEKLEEHVPTSPRASYEKPRVPLNNLKMKFEKGEDALGKVLRDRFTGEEHTRRTI